MLKKRSYKDSLNGKIFYVMITTTFRNQIQLLCYVQFIVFLKYIWKFDQTSKFYAAFKNYILEPLIDIFRMPIATFGTRLWSSTFLKKDKTKNKLACTITSAKVSLLTRWKKWLQFFVLSSLNTERWKLGFLCKLFEVSLLADYTLIGSREIPVCIS